jgi:LPXTG-motif cell wall-anchored protein
MMPISISGQGGAAAPSEAHAANTTTPSNYFNTGGFYGALSGYGNSTGGATSSPWFWVGLAGLALVLFALWRRKQ